MRIPSLVILVAATSFATQARGQDSAQGPEGDEPSVAGAPVLRLASPRPALSLEGVAGLVVQTMSARTRAHALAGATMRVRYGFIEVGGSYWVTDSGEATAFNEAVEEHYREVGGFVGGFVPFHRWLDFDGALGVASRTYANASPVYGPRGLSVSVPALTLRLSVSGRAGAGLLGGRVGGGFVATHDLSSRDVLEHHYFLENGVVRDSPGTVSMGGFSIACVMTVGLELGGRE
jgi:hypothetical protein